MIIGRKESLQTANYTSASLTTDGKHSWTFGKIDARIKLPKGTGAMACILDAGSEICQVGWPKCGEIDIMEHINNEDILTELFTGIMKSMSHLEGPPSVMLLNIIIILLSGIRNQ